MGEYGGIRRRLGHDQEFGWPEDFLTADMECAFTSRLFSGGDHERDTAVEAKPVPDQVACSRDERRYAGLHVAGTAAVQPAILHDPFEGWELPLVRSKWHDVDVPSEAERLAAGRPRDACDQCWSVLGKFVAGDVEPVFGQQPGNELGTFLLIAWRIDRSEPDELLREFETVQGHWCFHMKFRVVAGREFEVPKLDHEDPTSSSRITTIGKDPRPVGRPARVASSWSVSEQVIGRYSQLV